MLALVTLVRAFFVVNKNAIVYAFGFQGVGMTDNATYMLSKAYPALGPMYGIIASLIFSAAYSISNVFMSSLSKRTDKRVMLSLGALMFSMTSVVSGGTDSLFLFAYSRVLFGICASAINVPIYQLIASNFPIEYRSTANAIENSGYYLGSGVASLMVLIIKAKGWSAMYLTIGCLGVMVAVACALFIKNP